MKILLTAVAVCAALALPARAEDAGKPAAQPVKQESQKAQQAPKAKEAPKAQEAPKAKDVQKAKEAPKGNGGQKGKDAPKAKEPQKAKPAPKAGVSVSTVPAKGTAAVKEEAPPPALTPEELVIGELMKWDQKLLSLHARFTQEFDFSEAGLKQHIEGALDYKKPDLLRIEHIKPARQLVYTDKKDMWVYKPEDSQVIKTSWFAWRTTRTQAENLSGILDFGNYSSLKENNNINVSTRAPDPYIIVTLTPKAAQPPYTLTQRLLITAVAGVYGDGTQQPYTLTLRLSATDYFPAEASLSVDKTLITTKFESADKNVPLDDAIFNFIPPKGTEVLEFKN